MTKNAVPGKVDFCEEMRDRSGNVTDSCMLTSFLYELMRDHLPPGVVEKVVQGSVCSKKVQYTNGWLASYARDIATRLLDGQVEGHVLGSTCPRCSGDGERRGVEQPDPAWAETHDVDWANCELCGGSGLLPTLQELMTMQVDRDQRFESLRKKDERIKELEKERATWKAQIEQLHAEIKCRR